MGKVSDRRLARVRSLLMRTLSELIREELRDPRIGLFSLTDARLSKDLSYAEVKVSTVGDRGAIDGCAEALNAAAPLLWNRLRSATDLRVVPKLCFKPDHGGEYQDEVERLLKTIPQPAEEPAGLQEDEL